MKKIAGMIAVSAALVLSSCGGADSDTSPFIGKIEFKANGMGFNTKGSITVDAENQQMTYRMDALEQLMGMDVAMMVDMKNKKMFTICPSKNIYMEAPFKDEEIKGELPNKNEVDEMKKEFFSKLKKTGKQEVILGLTCDEYILKENTEGIESASIWVSKTMLDRMLSTWSMLPELKKLGMDELMIGFPLKGSFKADGKTGSFEVTKVTEGKDALKDFDLTKMKKMEQAEFSKKMMEGTAWGDMMNSFDDMEAQGFGDDLEQELEKLKDIDPKEIEKMMESMK